MDAEVRRKCNILFRQWANAYKGTPGLERIAILYKQLPTKAPRRLDQSQSKVLRETEAESPPRSPFGDPEMAQRTSTATSSSSGPAVPSRPVSLLSAASTQSSHSSFFKKDKKNKNKSFNLEKEKQQMLETIAQSSVASTNLLNALKLINRENEQVSDSAEVMRRFETCKVLRRQVLRYIQLVESEQWIGSLISANDELIKGLMAFEIMDKSIENDSDSDNDNDAYLAHKLDVHQKYGGHRDTEEALAGLNLNEPAPAKPPRPGSIGMPPPVPTTGKQSRHVEEEEDEEEDPFGDAYASQTPHVEKSGMTW